jgi:glycosyltransferase involved in cell wall biosynthesis
MLPKVTAIIPTYNEEKFIRNCIESIIAQDYKKELIEVFFIDGMSSDKTRNIIEEYSIRYQFIKLLYNPYLIVPYALNIGIAKSNGQFILRLDAHAKFPKNYFSTLILNAIELDSDNIGGVINTLPANDSPKAKSIALALSHPFGVGNSYFRVGTKNIRQVDTVPFGCFRRELFDKIGLFDVELMRNQDDEFNARIIKNGGKIFILPDLKIDYYARNTIGKLSKMFFQYSLFKPLVNKKLGKPATIRQFFPLLFISVLFIGLFLSLLNKVFVTPYFWFLGLYSITSIYFSLKIAIKSNNFKSFFFLPYIFLIIHLSYGLGYSFGIFKFLIFRTSKINVPINH